jgi:hypothetical protein
MRHRALGAFPMALPLLARSCGGESRPDSSHAAHTLDNGACARLPSEGF